jgi:transposase
MVAHSLDARSLVFVDEMGTNISLSPLYGWAKKGERARCAVPRNRGKNTTVLASMSLEGMGPSLAVEGATTAAVFEAYVEQVLAPSLRKGQVVVMDNLSAHKAQRIRELIEEWGCELLYLPPYSPDLNPIEEAFSKIKNLIRKAEARSREALLEVTSGQRSRRSPTKTPAVSSSTAATVQWFNCFDHRCRGDRDAGGSGGGGVVGGPDAVGSDRLGNPQLPRTQLLRGSVNRAAGEPRL